MSISVSVLFESLAYIGSGEKQHPLGREKEGRNYMDIYSYNSEKESGKCFCLQYAVKHITFLPLKYFCHWEKGIWSSIWHISKGTHKSFILSLGVNERSMHILRDPSSYSGFWVGNKIPQAVFFSSDNLCPGKKYFLVLSPSQKFTWVPNTATFNY